MDQHGRGTSGDSSEYPIEREYEDVAAVVYAAADASDSPVAVYGHSYGGLCAFGGVTLNSNIDKLVLYEGWPSVNSEPFAPDPDFLENIEAMLAEEDREAATETVFRVADAHQAEPSWQARVDSVHTYPREERAFGETPFDQEDAKNITILTLLPDRQRVSRHLAAEVVASKLPDVCVAVLEGFGPFAAITAPKLVAEKLRGFPDNRY